MAIVKSDRLDVERRHRARQVSPDPHPRPDREWVELWSWRKKIIEVLDGRPVTSDTKVKHFPE